jgi:hypothetical protein
MGRNVDQLLALPEVIPRYREPFHEMLYTVPRGTVTGLVMSVVPVMEKEMSALLMFAKSQNAPDCADVKEGTDTDVSAVPEML